MLEEEKIQLWKDVWRELSFNYLIKDNGLVLDSPQIIIRELILEIEENEIGNSENLKFFKKKVEYYTKFDQVFAEKFGSDFLLLSRAIHEKRNGYVLMLCKSIEQSFKNGDYFKELVKKAGELITNSDAITYDVYFSLKVLTQRILTEMILNEISAKEYTGMIENIFSEYKEYEFGYNTIFPVEFYGFEQLTRVNETKDEGISHFMQSLTTLQRIDTLINYFFIKPSKYKIIFVIRGLVGSKTFQLGDVTFYSPLNQSFGKDNALFREDLQEQGTKLRFLQAAVNVNYTTNSSALSDGIGKIETALDLLQTYTNTKSPLSIDVANYLIIDDEGNFFSSTSGLDRNDVIFHYTGGLNLDSFGDTLRELLLSDGSLDYILTSSGSKILNALHWFRKGNDSVKDADKLLNYWISIEHVFSNYKAISGDIIGQGDITGKLGIVQNTMVSICLLSTLDEEVWIIHRILRDRILNDLIILPDDLVTKAQLGKRISVEIHRDFFLGCLPEIIAHITDQALISRIEYVVDLFKNKISKKKYVETLTERVSDDVLMIYRFRNMIVHNASYRNALLPFYVWRARNLAGTLLRSMIDDLKKGMSTDKSLIGFRIFKDQFFMSLK